MRNNTLKFQKLSYIFCIVSGILLSIAFTFKSYWWICFFGLIPFFIVILGTNLNTRKFLKSVFLLSLGYYVPLMIWLLQISPILPFSKRNSLIILTFGIFLIGLLQGVYIAVATIFFPKIKTGKFRDVIFFSALFILGEWFQENTPFLAFPWAKLGVIASEYTAFIQSASVFGSLFISFLILFINGGVAFAILNYKNHEKVILVVEIISITFLLNIGFGVARINMQKPEKGFDALVVQGNYSGLNKWDATSYEMFLQYLKLTRSGITKDTKLVLWPETAIPTNFYAHDVFKSELLKFSKEFDTTIIVGFYIKKDDKQSYNALLSISPDGVIAKPYYKQILAPFGEYFPLSNFFRKVMPMMSDIIDNSSASLRGEKSQILESDIGKVGGIICYESVFSKIARNNVKDGAEILAIASNDSWFGETSALYQHHSHAIMRAVETKRFVLRASNTGISSIISPFGEIENSAIPFNANSASANVYLIKERTLYSIWGDIIILPCFFVLIYSISKCFKKKKINKFYGKNNNS